MHRSQSFLLHFRSVLRFPILKRLLPLPRRYCFHPCLLLAKSKIFASMLATSFVCLCICVSVCSRDRGPVLQIRYQNDFFVHDPEGHSKTPFNFERNRSKVKVKVMKNVKNIFSEGAVLQISKLFFLVCLFVCLLVCLLTG